MGSCISSTREDYKKQSSANVILSTGELRQFSIPVKASQVLFSHQTSSSSSSFFICNSDRLYFDDYIPALDPEDELEAGQIYFILPRSRLQHRLVASDMAALAVKATLALQQSNNNNNNRRHRPARTTSKSRISPLILSQSESGGDGYGQTISSNNNNNNSKVASTTSGLGVVPSSSRKLKRYSSRRAKMAVRSFRLRLTTIQEGSVLGQYY